MAERSVELIVRLLEDANPTVVLFDISSPGAARHMSERHSELADAIADRWPIVLYGDRTETPRTEPPAGPYDSPTRDGLLDLIAGLLPTPSFDEPPAESDRPTNRGAVAFFQSPSDSAAKGADSFKQNVRVGGLIEVGSQWHGADGKLLTFRITDCKHTVPVVYDGIPPDMVLEGKGVVAEGKFDMDGTLVATRVLAKHDENYMPKEAYDSLKRAADSEGEMTMTCTEGSGT